MNGLDQILVEPTWVKLPTSPGFSYSIFGMNSLDQGHTWFAGAQREPTHIRKDNPHK